MTLVSIYSLLNIPTIAPHPSIATLQWTAEGQLVFLCKDAIHILTPVPGLSIDTSSATKTTPIKLNRVSKPLGWLKTVIEPYKQLQEHPWSSDSQEWGAVSLGALDPLLRAMTISPSGLLLGNACVIALITSNLQISLWTANRDSLRGEWTMIF